MARGVNKVILIGNLGGEPEVRFLPSGGSVANISVATNESWRDKQTGETHDRTEWHRVVLFNRLAEIAKDYLHKGAKVFIEGRLQTRKWTDKDNIERYSTEIVGNEMQMLDGRGGNAGDGFDSAPPDHHSSDAGGSAAGSSSGGFVAAGGAQGRQSGQGSQGGRSAEPAGASYEDDVPF